MNYEDYEDEECVQCGEELKHCCSPIIAFKGDPFCSASCVAWYYSDGQPGCQTCGRTLRDESLIIEGHNFCDGECAAEYIQDTFELEYLEKSKTKPEKLNVSVKQ